ncbi:hypothetical protein [Desulforhopalus sp. 52FAK]
MSVGHIARGFEEAGIPTVVIAAIPFAKRLEVMSLPRVLLTPNLVGRVLGNPNDSKYQRGVLQKAVALLVAAEKNGTVESLKR